MALDEGAPVPGAGVGHQAAEGNVDLPGLLVLGGDVDDDAVWAWVVGAGAGVDLLVLEDGELVERALALGLEVLDLLAAVVEDVGVLPVADLLVAGLELAGLLAGVVHPRRGVGGLGAGGAAGEAAVGELGDDGAVLEGAVLKYCLDLPDVDGVF